MADEASPGARIRWSCGCLLARGWTEEVVVEGCDPLLEGHRTGDRWLTDRLEAFLYVLMRDHLPVGVVTKMVRDLQLSGRFKLTTPELAALARLRASELRG